MESYQKFVVARIAFAIALSFMCLSLGTHQPAEAVSTTVVISEIQTGSGSSGYDEFIEIYNKGSSAFDLNGYEVAKASAAGTVRVLTSFAASTVIPVGKHYLLAHNSGAFAGSADVTYTASPLADPAGQVGIRRASDQALVDGVAWGSITVNVFGEGASAGAAGANKSIERKPGYPGSNSTDTDDNSADFFVQSSPNPQNLSSPATAVTLSSFDARSPTPQPTFFRWQWLALAGAVIAFGGGAAVRRSLRR